MNKAIKAIIAVVVVVWVFAMGLEIGAYRERKAINEALSTTTTPTAPPQQTALPTNDTTQPINIDIVTNQPATEDPTEDNTVTTEKKNDSADTSTTAKAPESKVPQTKAEITAAFVKAMNATKTSTRSCTAQQDTDVAIQVTDCSVSAATSAINSVVQRFVGPESNTFEFVNGQTSDGKTINSEFPPSDRQVVLDEAGVKSAEASPYGNGGYTLKLTLVPETSTLDNEPKYHANSVGYLNMASVDIGGATITQADFSYSGTTVEISVNGDGLVEKYHCVLPLAGTGTGKLGFISAGATLEGSNTESWTFSWK